MDKDKMNGMDHNHMKMDMNGDKDHNHMDMNHDHHGQMKMDHGDMNHDDMGNMNMDHDKMNHGDMDHMNMDHGSMDHGQMMMHGGHMMNMGNLKKKFWVSLILMIPILLMSPMMGMKLPLQVFFPGSDWIVAILGTIIFFYGGQPFFSGAKGEMASHKPAMMSLISMGISVAYIYSLYSVIANNVFGQNVSNFFWELSTLIVIMLLGHWIEMNSLMSAGSALNQLSKLLPNDAHLVTKEGQTKDIPLSSVNEGDNLLVKAGEQIPADGTILEGQTNVNESLVTGESRSVKKDVNDKLIGGSINEDGTITMNVTGTGKSGYLSKVMDMVSSAQGLQSKTENLADRVAGYLFYAALAIAIISWLVWSFINGVAFATEIAVTVLIIACPHALGLAVPLVVSRSTSIAATHGLLIRNRDALEGAKDIRYALMDKTGTLTQGQFKVNDYQSLTKDLTNDKVLQLIASVEQSSSHPLASGILDKAEEMKMHLLPVENAKQITGVGIQGDINGITYQVVGKSYLDSHQIKFNENQFNDLAGQGNSVSFLVADGELLGIIGEGDQLKPNSQAMIDYFKKIRIIPVMLTGDNEQSAAKIAHALGIEKFEANLKPEDKQKLVAKYQKDGSVMFIGDGINDAPSLVKANLGVAIGSGTDVAIDSADAVLVNSDPKDVIDLLELMRATEHKMVENLWWGAGYNIIALPLAAGVLGFMGFILPPMVGAIVMSLSTVVVAINALTLHIKD